MPSISRGASWTNFPLTITRTDSVDRERIRKERKDWTWVDYSLNAVLKTQWIGQPIGPVLWFAERAYSFELGKQMKDVNTRSLERISLEDGEVERILEGVAQQIFVIGNEQQESAKGRDENQEAPPPYSSLSRSSTVPSYESRTMSQRKTSNYATSTNPDEGVESESLEKSLLKAVDAALDRRLANSDDASTLASESIDSLPSLSRSTTISIGSSTTNSTLPSRSNAISAYCSSESSTSSRIDNFVTSRTSRDNETASLSTVTTASLEDDALLASALDFTGGQSLPKNLPHLQVPIAIPQITHGLGAPFARAYSPVLGSYNITAEAFLAFVDNLNIVATRSPSLAFIATVANVASIVPFDMAQLASSVLWLAAEAGTVVLCRKRVRAYMRRVNTEFFGPRGLKVECCSGWKLKHALGMDLKETLVVPLEGMEGRVEDTGVVERRMESLGQNVAELTFKVPPPGKQTQLLRRLSEMQVQRDLRKAERVLLKRRVKAVEKRKKQEEKAGAKTESKSFEKYKKAKARIEEERAKINIKTEQNALNTRCESSQTTKQQKINAKAEQKQQRELEKLSKAEQKAESKLEKGTAKEKRKRERPDTELGVSRTLYWLLIRNLGDEDLPDLKKDSQQENSNPKNSLKLCTAVPSR